ncbi:hypothetical protein COT51_02610 [candidate division WWE3 bacterium CG08_land_8_20_14_0_20_41_15]|uniref:CopG family transcriptional regulator n=1 Tax=candidate division WWE3 bacterium CG08_land_8_20_14_0_20_41_15 TaxID=1975086 RepID=A0A2H0X953_UNCKA|nr:MAG: hypothetical protein COT51_02610 [candidate division WWE3 bacterium CG08_land_8_20_14_0_20_41_15]
MKKNQKSKILPQFKSEDEERDFWATHDLTDYIDSFEPVELDLSALKPPTRPITVRLPLRLVVDLKRLANKKDVPYQSLLKVYLAEKVREEVLADNKAS